MRPLAVALLALLVALLAGCGSDDNGPQRPVYLKMTGPDDGTVLRSDDVELTGRVTPGALVTVEGEPVTERGGGFTARVPLDAGGNVIDVIASVRGMRPSMTALRVVRKLTVRIPDVIGDSPGDARERLAAAGLSVEVHEGGGLIDELLPVDRIVCNVDPDAGSTVDSGATVTLTVAKVC
jgi:hypothetical protein